eukprot:TRINITY_DN8723_c0_g1_i3.p1 TRINITY_DN8723_c0_g1~~TRINITY_DN8723_c0_g1_i3.p1  ORF type:complete len:126 (-),score=82.69 TRINITY_DN8723_c0_g1_i3:148-480(-)
MFLVFFSFFFFFFFFQAEDGIRDVERSRGLGDVYKRQEIENAVDKLVKKLNKKQDVERATDSMRGFLKAFAAIGKVPEIDLNENFQGCKKKLMADPIVKGIFSELTKSID